ncbi:crosslink repair DNA glycosylase YcaQ family protein [Kribbella sp. NPDC049584]|uniref:DNA glycosylase AlkZ-like family protein n=1 Tax=Kribbella sp. NPDC049584 TaxID=3154833 RepID=UPI003414716A
MNAFQPAELVKPLEHRQPFRASLMRATIHLLSSRDFPAFRPSSSPTWPEIEPPLASSPNTTTSSSPTPGGSRRRRSARGVVRYGRCCSCSRARTLSGSEGALAMKCERRLASRPRAC